MLRLNPQTHFCAGHRTMDLSVVDMAVNRVGVEHSRVALLGISFGGYFVLRATAVDDRVAAVVAKLSRC